jgi:predicted  nucleic acid-binding Zn-ribbon protein
VNRPDAELMLNFGLIREEIILSYRERIALGKRLKLYKSELDTLIQTFIECLKGLSTPDEIQTLCQAEIALLEEGYERLTLASDYIPRYRKAIEEAIAEGRLSDGDTHQYIHRQRVTGIAETRQEHWALTFFKYSPEEYEALDQRQARVNRKRLLNLKSVDPWLYVAKLDELLHSAGKFAARHRAIAIAGLTGRRIGEVLARGAFSLTEHPFMLHFTGQQKHERDGYAILTLIPAETLLQEIEKFRAMAETRLLMTLDGKSLTQAINKFDVQVNRECDRLLMNPGIVPPLEGKAHVTVHNLRSLWGAIAVYLFCPPQHHEYAFLQHYLGHVLESPATGHYFRYQLVDAKGHPIHEKGIKLASVPELPLLEDEWVGNYSDTPPTQFVDEMKESELQTHLFTESQEAESSPPSSTSPAKSTRKSQMSKSKPPSPQEKAQKDSPSLSEIEGLKAYVDHQLQELHQLLNRQQGAQAASHQSDDSAEQLRQENQSLKDNIAKLLRQERQYVAELAQLRSENQALQTQLQEAQSKLDRFRQLLMGDEAEVSQPEKSQPDTLPQPIPPSVVNPSPQTEEQTIVIAATRGRKPGKALERAVHIFDAVREWNRLHPEETFAINPGLLETVFKVHRKAAKQFCEEYQNDLWDYHQEIGVQSEHAHNRGKDLQQLWQFVQQYF